MQPARPSQKPSHKPSHKPSQKPSAEREVIVTSLPKLGTDLLSELAKLNKAYAEILPKHMTVDKSGKFWVGARQIHVGDNLVTLFSSPATASQLALEQEARDKKSSE